MAEILGFKIECRMDGGEVLIATTDQRDVAAWEASEAYSEVSALQTRTRHYAWSALKRSKQISQSWEKFNTETCVQAWVIEALGVEDTEEPEGEEGENPSPA